MSDTFSNVTLSHVLPKGGNSLFTPSEYYDIVAFHKLLQTVNTTNNFSIFNSNARSLVKHKTDYNILFDTLSETNGFSFDMLTFTESWLNADLENLAQFDNYDSVFKHKSTTKEGGGIAVYLRQGIEFKVRNDISFPESSRFMFDCLFIEVMCNKAIPHTHSKNIIVCVIYRSPSFSKLQEFTNALSALIDKIQREGKHIIITGDSNIDLLQINAVAPNMEFFDMLISHNLLPNISLPTRVTQSSATLIDHIWSNIPPEQAIAGTMTTDITDHFSNFIFCEQFNKIPVQPRYISVRKMTKQHLNAFNAIENENWDNVYHSNNVDIAYCNFMSTYMKHVNTHLPMQKKCFNRKKHKIEPWMTQGLLKSMRTKEKLYKKMLTARNTVSYVNHESKYKEYLSLYKKSIRAAKNQFWLLRFEDTKSDIKRTWKNINTLLNNKSKNHSFPSQFHHNGNTISNPKEIADSFNDYFVNAAPNLASKIPSFPSIGNSRTLLERDLPNSFFFEPTTHFEISKIIDSLKPKTSCGHDDVSPKLVSKTVRSISFPLAHVINLSLESGVFPSEMKLAKVVPIFKSKDSTSFSNYRPISLLPTFSKVIERLVHKRLMHYLNSHNLLCQSQYGFLRNSSTEYAILELQNRISNSMGKNEWCAAIFLDLSKAFDTLDHQILSSKLYHLGVRGNALLWFQNYLFNRCQFTEYKSHHSSKQHVPCGVPQGSILGPLLFLIYIDDVYLHLKNCNVILFADDTTMFTSDSKFDSLLSNLNENISIIYKWLCLNKLSLNIDKTNYIVFHSSRKKLPHTPIVLLNNNEIKQVDHTKFLGVYIDKNLNWKKHCSEIGNKCLKVNAVLSRLKNYVPPYILRTIYLSLFLSHLTYGITAWGKCAGAEMKHLQVLQKKSIRIISKSRFNSHVDPICKNLRLLKLDDLFLLNCCKLYYKSLNGMLKSYFNEQLLPNTAIYNYSTRRRNDIHQHNIRRTVQSQSLNFKVSSAWNDLPPNLKANHNKSIHTFTKLLKTYYISKYNDACREKNCFICSNQRNQQNPN
jgi:exonuclease III